MPSPARSQEIHYEGDEHEIWLGEISNGFKVGQSLSPFIFYIFSLHFS